MSIITEITNRKISHFDLCANHDVEFRNKTTMFEDVELLHQPVCSASLDRIDTSVEYLGKRLNYPLIITAMTGGAAEVARFNREIAGLAGRLGIGFGVGSQRAMMRDPELRSTFDVRRFAPDLLLLGNIGIAQAREMTTQQVAGLAREIGADAMCIHLNVAMEIVQEGGDSDFRGSLEAIRRIVEESPVPILVKETGCGFSRESGEMLAAAGVKWVDVAGAGGTSWVGVETIRNRALRHLGEAFWDWGIPTAASLCELRGLGLELIASGGVRTGIDVAKSLALGARVAGVALPVVRAWVAGGVDEVEKYLLGLLEELRVALMLSGCERAGDMTAGRAVIRGSLLEWVSRRRLNLE